MHASTKIRPDSLLSEISRTIATSAILMAPFTWSYVGSVGGMLIRAVDLYMIALILVVALQGRITCLPGKVPALMYCLICLLLLRSIGYSDSSAAISAIKISYYLIAAIMMATAFRDVQNRPKDRSNIYALVLVSPVLALFMFQLSAVFIELAQSRSLLSGSQILFRGWNEIFSQNIFGANDALDITGVSFRNSAGIAFVVAALHMFMREGKVSSVVMLLLMGTAALLFSRSVWLIQLLFLALLILRSRGRIRIVLTFILAIVTVLVLISPFLSEAISQRVNSNFGRSEMIYAAFDKFDSAFIFGRNEGAEVVLLDGEMKSVHNVPLGFLLKTGVIGFLLSCAISFIFLYSAVVRLFDLVLGVVDSPRQSIVVVVVSVILFSRPMVSASHDVFFSIGEWCALAMYLAYGGPRFARVRYKKRLAFSPQRT